MLALLVCAVFSLEARQAAYGSEQTGSADRKPAIAFAARVIGDDNRARLIVDFDREVSYDSYVLDSPRRIVIDLSPTLFSLEGEAQRLPRALVKAMRYGAIGIEQSRIVLELAKPVKIEDHVLREVASQSRHRLMVDLISSTEADFAAAVRKPTKADGNNDSAVDPSQTAAIGVGKGAKAAPFRVVLDPGHGGVDGGARGQGGTIEKYITLEFAQELKQALEKDDRIEVLLTRNNDRFLALRERVEFARSNKADLFLSIHADSLRQRYIRGATVYTLSEEGSDEISKALARKQNRADLAAGLSLPTVKPVVTDILIDMTRRETENFSRRFAQLMVSSMREKVKMIRNPHRSADFYVLKAPEVPSVLLELGYLSNREDEALMASADWQRKTVEQISTAISDYLEIRLR